MKRWAIAGAAAAALVVGATGLAASSPTSDSPLGPFFLGPKMARAEVVMVYGGSVHDWARWFLHRRQWGPLGSTDQWLYVRKGLRRANA